MQEASSPTHPSKSPARTGRMVRVVFPRDYSPEKIFEVLQEIRRRYGPPSQT